MDDSRRDTPTETEKAAIVRLIKDTRGQYYLFAAIGLGLPLVLWLVLPDPGDSEVLGVFTYAMYVLPPLVVGVFLLVEEREVYLLRQALWRGVTCHDDVVVQEVNVPPQSGRGAGKRQWYSIRVARRLYWVDRKTCSELSPDDRVSVRVVPGTKLALEVRKITGKGPKGSRLLYRYRARPGR